MFQHVLVSAKKRCFAWLCTLLLVSSFLLMMSYKENLLAPRLKSHKSFPSTFNGSFATDDESFTNNNNSTSNKIVCMILTRASNWATRGKAVRNTWAGRCHRALFFYSRIECSSSQPICKEPNAVPLDITDGRDHLTAKSLGAFAYSYNKYGEEADYFLKADDDSYVIMENLEEIISRFSSNPLLYLGRTIKNILPKGYNSGGAGYLMSRRAIQLLVQNRTMFPSECHSDGGAEDVEVGRCLAKFGVYPEEEMDSTKRLTFHSDNPLLVLQGQSVANSYFIDFRGAEFGNKKTISERGFMLSRWTATMHYVSPAEMYMYDFLLYDLNRRDSSYRRQTDS